MFISLKKNRSWLWAAFLDALHIFGHNSAVILHRVIDTSVIIYNTDPGGRLNKKDGRTRYGDSHVKDKTS